MHPVQTVRRVQTPAYAPTFGLPAPVRPAPPGGDRVDLSTAGQQAVNQAAQFLHQPSAHLVGLLPNFEAAGGQDNDCADFVSSLLQNNGLLQGHYTGVSQLKTALQQQGYRAVPASQAQPGDVWIASRNAHAELVADAGGKTLIGSNNEQRNRQSISYSGPWGQGQYFQLPRGS